jgi:6-phosphogluconolactonase
MSETDIQMRLVAYVGSYENSPNPGGGGIYALELSPNGETLTPLTQTAEPKQAGYLVYAPSLQTLYSVDERKTDGRGPVGAAASVHAFAVNVQDASLRWLNSCLAPGPYPTFLALDEAKHILVSANHGSYEHIEHVVQTEDGSWDTQYLYDDSTVVVYALENSGQIKAISDVQILKGHGKDPNRSPQAGGHGQASSHAHCAVIDPTGNFLLVCDKGTDQILVFRLGAKLELASSYQMPQETGPRHLAFDPVSGLVLVTLEFSSQLASFEFNTDSAELQLLDQKATVTPEFKGLNEPAEVRVHPKGKFVYVNNRGEDTLVWFALDSAGCLSRLGDVPLAKSIHPGLAARSFTFSLDGSLMLVADRPADSLRLYAVDEQHGSLQFLNETHVPNPAFIVLTELRR